MTLHGWAGGLIVNGWQYSIWHWHKTRIYSSHRSWGWSWNLEYKSTNHILNSFPNAFISWVELSSTEYAQFLELTILEVMRRILAKKTPNRRFNLKLGMNPLQCNFLFLLHILYLSNFLLQILNLTRYILH